MWFGCGLGTVSVVPDDEGGRRQLTPSRLGRALPEDACPVDWLEGVDDSVCGSEFVDGKLALGDAVVIVDYGETARGEFWVERIESHHRRLEHIPVETQHGNLLNQGVRQCVSEPAGKETNVLVEQAEPGEVPLDLFK